MRKSLLVAPLIATLSFAAFAQDVPRSAPVAVPIAQTVPDAVDTPWPGGTIQLDVDATDIAHNVFGVTETIPLAPGTRQLTLLYPQWLPGHHAPRGPLADVAGLSFTVDGRPLAWTRDPVEVYAFHLDLPEGAKTVQARFVYTSPLVPNEGRVAVTPDMLNLQWETVSLYPAGHYVRRIRVRPSVTLPQGWQAATALDGGSSAANRRSYAETDYETLVDSPLWAGAWFRKWDLGHGITLNAFADEAPLLELRPENAAKLSALADEATILFGSRHFDHYEFLVALSGKLGGIGLEHHRSSENQLEAKSFTQWDDYDWDRNVLPHELAHSWNGKFRRPARLWTPDYRQPMQDDLLWLYEGQTQLWGHVLAARSGVQSKAMVLAMLASTAGRYAEQPGRDWRSVGDTTNDPIISARRPRPFPSLSRDEDYYNEGMLIWLEADQVIREGTHGGKSLDDFARAFFGIRDGDWGEVTYEFSDIVSALNSVYPYDWAAFLHSRIDQAGRPAPLAGIEKSGYRLVWRDQPNPFDKARMADAKMLNLYHSLGITLDNEGAVTGTRWQGPAFKAGIVNGAKIIAVNGIAYDQDRLKEAITAAKGGSGPIELLIRRGDRFSFASVNWSGGLRWPWLEKATPGAAPVPLDNLLAPRRGTRR